MNKTVRSLVDSFRREHPFTHLPHEVLNLLEAAYEAGRNAEAIEQWTQGD